MAGNFKIPKIGITIITILVIIMAAGVITQFFNISLAEYIPYLTWIIALAIFFSLLPHHVGKVFLTK